MEGKENEGREEGRRIEGQREKKRKQGRGEVGRRESGRSCLSEREMEEGRTWAASRKEDLPAMLEEESVWALKGTGQTIRMRFKN